MEKTLLANFKSYISQNLLLAPDDKVLAAVSGGVDSMVLLSLLVEGGWNVSVAHCNFQLRGEESYEDEVLVEKQAAAYGIPFFNMRFDTAGEMERTGESVQLAARRLRYSWFNELCAEHGYTVIAIAHHADDSVETFFINLLRGTGLRGLTGIGAVNGRVVRPLLSATRREILEYAAAHKIQFREDSSNRSTKYLRNKIRLGLVPRLKEINPRFPDIMGGNIKRLTDAQLFIDHAIGLIREVAEQREGDMILIDPSRIDPGFPQEFVIYELLSCYGFKGDVIEGLYDSMAAGSSGKKFYSREYTAYTDRGKIIVAPVMQQDDCAVEIACDTHRIYCGNSVLYFDVIDVDAVESLNQPANIALLDADKLTFPLKARRWAEGDRFCPFGMGGESKKVSDYLVDNKVSMPQKQRQFVVLSGEEIVWLVGRRIDQRYSVTSDTENILRIVKEII